MKRLVCCVGLLLALGGCADGAAPAKPRPVTTQSHSANSASAPVATTAQWASIIAETRPNYQKSLELLSDCFGVDSDAASCEFAPLALKMQAETLIIMLRGATEPRARGYIGDPPAEIANLVEETRIAAQDAIDGFDRYQTKKECPGGASCMGAYARMGYLLKALGRQMDAWQPYL